MNLLIFGGLLLVAVAAILGAILLGVSEQRAEKARANGVPAPRSTATISLEDHPSGPTGTLTPPGQNATSGLERPLPARGDSQQLSAFNGQFRELAGELHSLYQQAWELEQRLRGITEIVDRIEESQGGRFSIEEEAHSHSSVDSSAL